MGAKSGSAWAWAHFSADLGSDLVRAQPGCLVKHLAGDHQFVGGSARNKFGELPLHRGGGADGRAGQHALQHGAHLAVNPGSVARQGRRQTPGATAAQVHKGLLHRGGKHFCLSISIGCKYIEAQHHIGLGQTCRRFEIAAVDVDRLQHRLRCEMRCKGIGQAECGRQLRAIQARTQNPDRDVQPLTGYGSYRAFGFGCKIIHQLQHILGELVRI